MRTGTEPNMGKQEGNTGRRQNWSPMGCDTLQNIALEINILIKHRT